ncbi:MAG: S-layer homology domain-containing protein [Thermoleophilia bacterium]
MGAFGYHDLEITNVDSPTFSDVPSTTDPYPFDFVEEAAGNFLVTGFADGTFRPWEPLTRIQLLRILVRSREFYLEDPPAEYRLPFGDVPDADRSFVAIAHYNGLVNGKDATRFDPYGLATRGHVAKILYKALENSYEWPEEELTPAEAAAVRELSLSVRE